MIYLLHLESSFSPSAEEQDFWRNHHEAESEDHLPVVTRGGKSINTKPHMHITTCTLLVQHFKSCVSMS